MSGSPASAQVAPGATTQTAQQARSPRVAGDGLEWLAEATLADDFRETPAEPAETLPYERAYDGQTTLPTAAKTFQPAGALSGRVVYLMAGHGWTYSDERQTWGTQRPPTHGLVEDLGNLDQMHIFARMVWNAGGTVVPLRPVDHQPEERVVDNSMTQASFYGPWRPSSSALHYGTARDRVPYLFAHASMEESAVARYRPYIPTDGEYPVYVWARDGSDRIEQTYRVAHAGGIHSIKVNHRQVGKGWVWLGTYRFNEGDTGYVEISNLAGDPYQANGSNVVVADAVRFGNGRGDARREGGISGYLREDEGDAYWIQDSLGHTAPPRLYTVGRQDSAATVGSPPKAAAYMNRETEGRYSDRVLISFHSNAATGKQRGAVGLFNRRPSQRPEYQELLAELTGRQINEDMRRAPSVPGLPWSDRTRHTYNGIDFGELRKDYLQGELCATIVETAFHDNAEDARYLLSPQGRIDMARSTLRGVIKWFDAIERPRHSTAMPPSLPQKVRVAAVDNAASATVSWEPGKSDKVTGNPATDYRVFLSYDGRAFDGGILSDGETSLAVPTGSTTATVFVRVAAVNPSGESFASGALAVRAAGETSAPAAKILLVDGADERNPALNPSYRQHVADPDAGPGWTVERVRPLLYTTGEAIVRTAGALTEAGMKFDTAQASAVESGEVSLKNYQIVVWLAGIRSSPSGLLSAETRKHLVSFVVNGGRMFLSGSSVASELAGGVTHDERRTLLASEYKGANTDSRSLAPTAAFAAVGPLALERDESAPSIPEPLATDIVTPLESRSVRELLTYRWPATGAAAVASRNVVYFAFPFESLSDDGTRARVMEEVLKILENR